MTKSEASNDRKEAFYTLADVNCATLCIHSTNERTVGKYKKEVHI